LRDKLVDGIFAELDDLRFNGPKGDKRSPDNANVSILRAEGDCMRELSMRFT
jgi:cysteine desulfurase